MENRVILALDVPYLWGWSEINLDRLVDAGLQNVKLGPQNFLDYGFTDTLIRLQGMDVGIFLDLKLADTFDTTMSVVNRCEDFGIKFLTVSEQSFYDAIRHKTSPDKFLTVSEQSFYDAIRHKTSPDLKLLSIVHRTDTVQTYIDRMFRIDAANFGDGKNRADGVIMPAGPDFLVNYASARDLIVVSPGIRLDENDNNNHKEVFTPKQAIKNGVDYIVVGRPIYEAKDPVVAFKNIVSQMREGLNERKEE